jgi:hypothetical protein
LQIATAYGHDCFARQNATNYLYEIAIRSPSCHSATFDVVIGLLDENKRM